LTSTQTATSSTHPTKMRLYNIVSEILLILPIIDFAVTAPVLVQEKLQARVNVVHIPAHAMTMLWKRADDSELDELGVKLFSHPESHSVSKPEELSAAHPPGGVVSYKSVVELTAAGAR
jgi:hypothetical protein